MPSSLWLFQDVSFESSSTFSGATHWLTEWGEVQKIELKNSNNAVPFTQSQQAKQRSGS